MEGNTTSNRPANSLLKPVLPATAVFAMICTVDLISTVVLIVLGIGAEANPVLAPTLAYGLEAFTAVKIFSFLVPLTVAEILRPKSPQFIERVVQLGLIGYLVVYAVGAFSINKHWIAEAFPNLPF